MMMIIIIIIIIVIIIIIIMVIIGKKNRDKSGKNTGREKESQGKISLGESLATCKKFSHFSPTFPPIRYLLSVK